MLYDWQAEAIAAIRGKNAILSAPTGSGKTRVAYLWSGLTDGDGNTLPPSGRVIFTAPIKALSNERYMELKSMGLDAGLETGDFKKNAAAPVLCCTQEIYTLKYARIPRQKVIVDEFHYIFNDPERTRAYIDGLRKTSVDSGILVMSATFGNPRYIKNYLEGIAERDFELFETKKRVTGLVFKKAGLRFPQIHDALVFAFSKKGVEWLAGQIAGSRKMVGREERARLREMADILEIDRLPGVMLNGVGIYCGSMLPKEKLLVEMAFRERILDVVVGTDALSLGVNLPAQTVVFGQMAKFIDGPLTKNEFLQMAGRAGRKGYFNPGYVAYIPRSKCEHHGYDTALLYLEKLEAPCEEARIRVLPSVGRLLKRDVEPEAEAKMIAECSLPRRSFSSALREVEALMSDIKESLRRIKDQTLRRRVKKILADIWSDEMDAASNIGIAALFAESDAPDAMRAADILKRSERNYLQALLKIKRFANRLPCGYRFSRMAQIDLTVDRIDASVFGFEEKISMIKTTEYSREAKG